MINNAGAQEPRLEHAENDGKRHVRAKGARSQQPQDKEWGTSAVKYGLYWGQG